MSTSTCWGDGPRAKFRSWSELDNRENIGYSVDSFVVCNWLFTDQLQIINVRCPVLMGGVLFKDLSWLKFNYDLVRPLSRRCDALTTKFYGMG